MIFNLGGGMRNASNFVFTPTGGGPITVTPSTASFDDESCRFARDGIDWRFEMLKSGTVVFTSPAFIDFFLCGGGGNGDKGRRSYWQDEYKNIYDTRTGGGGGGGGYRESIYNRFADSTYQITIGSAGGSTSAFGDTVNGGGNASGETPGTGGSNGGHATNAGNVRNGADGEHPFGDTSLPKYGGGGGSGAYYYNHGNSWAGGVGGSDGAGNGAVSTGDSGSPATANTGGGGGGGYIGFSGSATYATPGGAGGSGIVIIRNHREAA